MRKKEIALAIISFLLVANSYLSDEVQIKDGKNGINAETVIINNIVQSSIDPATLDTSWTIIDETSVSGIKLNSLLSKLISEGKRKFYIKDGNYYLDDVILVNQQNVILQGQSQENTKIIQNNSTSNGIEVAADGLQISDLNIDSRAGKIAVYSLNSNNSLLKDCIIHGSSNNSAVAFYGGNSVDNITAVESRILNDSNIIENNIIYSELTGDQRDGIVFNRQKNGFVRGNTVVGSRIAFYISRNSEVSNNIIKDSSTNGIRYTVPAYDNKILNNTIQASKGSGITVDRNDKGVTTSDYRATGLIMSNNNIIDTRYFGIEISNLKDSNISNNFIDKIDFDGVYLLFSDNLLLQNNKIHNTGLSIVRGKLWDWGESSNSGIILDYMVTNCLIDSNELLNDMSNCFYGIRINSHNGNVLNHITNNIVSGYYLNGITANEALPEQTEIAGNIVNLSMLPVPLNIKAAATLNSITLSWDAEAAAAGYEIDANGTIIDNGTSTSYSITGLNPATEYHYKVRAKYGIWSDDIKATTQLLPAPNNIKTVTTVDGVTLSWDAEAGATGYEIDANGTIIDNGTSTSYSITGLSAATEYYYKVRAKNGIWSDDIKATTQLLPAPSNIKAVTTVDGVTLSWDAEEGATGYEIDAGGIIIDNGTSTSYFITGLNPATDYHYKVRAKNGNWSSDIKATTQLLPAPSNIKAVTTVDGVTLSWDAEEGATGYEIDAGGTIIDNGTSTSYSITGLNPATDYHYKVRAKNGNWSDEITAKTLTPPPPSIVLPPPLPPPAVVLPPPLPSPVPIPQTVPIVPEQVQPATSPTPLPAPVQAPISQNTVVSQDTKIVSATESVKRSEKMKKTAVNEDKTDKSKIDNETKPSPKELPAPQNIKAASTEDTIILSWDAEEGATGYEIDADGTIIDNGTNTSYTAIGLKSGISCNYRVRAKGGAWSNTITAATLNKKSVNSDIHKDKFVLRKLLVTILVISGVSVIGLLAWLKNLKKK